MDVDLELGMNISCKELRVLLLQEFRLGHKTTEATSNICSTMSKDALFIHTAQDWFNWFKNDNFELDDLPRAGRPLEVDMDVLKQLAEEDPRLTTRCLAERLGCSHATVETHLRELGKTWKYGVWIPHELSPLQLQHRVDACMKLLTSHHNYQWLHNLITGDEKLGSYRLPLVPFAVQSSKREKIRRRKAPQNGSCRLLRPKVPGLLRTCELFATRALATSHRY
ncbi:unnamed protein product [Rotaria socialis]|uniref:Mos1 transposase HTH domain-containing protein n=2 Tax=Rotaria socialis TaxID=392032 RepID=A0A821FJF6_9BILA|nr:unnamed protein product [Rotaria socialis]CAF4650325.1 unnamed protein product [Rotaria socialis]